MIQHIAFSFPSSKLFPKAMPVVVLRFLPEDIGPFKTVIQVCFCTKISWNGNITHKLFSLPQGLLFYIVFEEKLGKGVLHLTGWTLTLSHIFSTLHLMCLSVIGGDNIRTRKWVHQHSQIVFIPYRFIYTLWTLADDVWFNSIIV